MLSSGGQCWFWFNLIVISIRGRGHESHDCHMVVVITFHIHAFGSISLLFCLKTTTQTGKEKHTCDVNSSLPFNQI